MIGTLTIGCIYLNEEKEQLVEVIRQIAVQAHGPEDTLYIDFIFKYKRSVHHRCTLGRKVMVVTNAPEEASFSVGYIEDSLTDLVLDQAGIDPRLPSIYAVTHDELFEGSKAKQILVVYIGEQPIDPCEQPWMRLQVRGYRAPVDSIVL